MHSIITGVQPLAVVPTEPSGPAIGIPHPLADLGQYLIGHVVDAVTGLLRSLSQDFLGQLAAPVARYVLHTPDLLTEPTLRQYWLTSLAVLGACVALLLALAGLAMIPGPSSRLAMSARETLGLRFAGGLLTAAVSLPLVALEVQLANRVVDAFVAGGFDRADNPVSAAFHRVLQGNVAAGLAVLVTVTVGVILLVALLVLGLVRWATLWLLVILAPVVMGLAVLPGGGGVARLWWRLQLTTVLLPVANAVLLGTYVALFSSDRSGLVGALSGVAILALMVKIPGWAAGAAAGVEAAEVTGRLRRARLMARHRPRTQSAAPASGNRLNGNRFTGSREVQA
ncbi:MAG TPA: hypothetical protein VGN54_04450 [Mycobacteriales bacterium]|nr:hypothetical protein [Mycobacteriales bacterium]